MNKLFLKTYIIEREKISNLYFLIFRERDKIDLFSTEPLGIFTAQSKESKIEKSTEPVLKTWNFLEERELRLAVTHPPENYFQEMILWTQQGKVWKFPIDNEQGKKIIIEEDIIV